MKGLREHENRGNSTSAQLLDLEGIAVSYGRRQALFVERVVLDRSAVGLLGPNGAGKSTLLKVLLGLLSAARGRGRVLGLEVGREAVSIRERVGYMSEDNCFVPGLTAVEIVTLAGELAGMPRRDALGRAHEVLSYLGLDEARYRRVEEYSSGMSQRLKLAQALVHDPPLLILDEPTNGLDPSGRRQILDLIAVLNREHGKSVLLSTHLLEDVERVCDSALILHRGRVIASGPLDQLLHRRRGRYRLELQGKGDDFLERLRGEGLRIVSRRSAASSAPGQELQVVSAEGPADFPPRRFFQILAGMDPARAPALRSLRPDPERLEDLFARLVEEQDAGIASRGACPETPRRTETEREVRGQGATTTRYLRSLSCRRSDADPRASQPVPHPPEARAGRGVFGQAPRRADVSVESTGYRPWGGRRRGALLRFLPIARSGLRLLVRRKLFWFILALGLMNFVFHAGVVYLFTEVAAQFNLQSDELRERLPPALRRMAFTGSGRAYQNFIFSQNIVLMLLLGFAGVITVAGDFRHRALSFYLSRPIGKLHFFLGKLLAVGALAASLTLLPAIVLFAEYGAFTRSLDYWRQNSRLFWGILASGALVSVVSSTMILGVAAWFRRASPTVLAWSGIFVLLPIISSLLRRQVQRIVGYERAWYCGLPNVWNDLRWVSRALFGDEPETDPDRYTHRLAWALVVLGLLVGLSLVAFWRRVRATEVVK